MEIWSTFLGFLQNLQNSTILRGAVSTLAFAALLLGLIVVLAGLSWVIHKFFLKYDEIRRFHRICVYIGMMGGVVLMIAAGLIGFMFPIIPGWLLIAFALILLRSHHKIPWLDRKIFWIERKMHKRPGHFYKKLSIKRGVIDLEEIKEERRKRLHEMGKALRIEKKRKK